MKTKIDSTLSILLATAILLPSCNAKYDMVTFNAVGLMPAAKTPVPKIEIDTNVTAGMMGGDVKSNKPYDIRDAAATSLSGVLRESDFANNALARSTARNFPRIMIRFGPLHFQRLDGRIHDRILPSIYQLSIVGSQGMDLAAFEKIRAACLVDQHRHIRRDPLAMWGVA